MCVEGLYCKRPIQCLASSEILTTPLTAPGECVPPPPTPLGGGGRHTRWVERGWGSIVRKTPDTALYSVYESTLCTSVLDQEMIEVTKKKIKFLLTSGPRILIFFFLLLIEIANFMAMSYVIE
jgi:hypothetical protein